MKLLGWILSLFGGEGGSKRSSAALSTADPIAVELKALRGLRAYAINLPTGSELQAHAYEICDHLQFALGEARRKPGSLPILGPSVLVTDLLKSLLDRWLRLSRSNVTDAKTKGELQEIEDKFKALVPKYRGLRARIQTDLVSELRIDVDAIRGLLAETPDEDPLLGGDKSSG